MVYEARKQSMAWMETDYLKHMHFRWKIKWRLEHLGALGIMGEATPLNIKSVYCICHLEYKLYRILLRTGNHKSTSVMSHGRKNCEEVPLP